MTQSVYRNGPTGGQPGTPYDNGPTPDVPSGLVQGTAVAPGIAVFAGSVQRGVKAPTAAGDVTSAKFQGIVQLTESKVSPEYAVGTFAPVQRNGRIIPLFESDVAATAHGAVYVRHTANGAGKTVLGALRANADSGNAALLPGFEWYLDSVADFVVVDIRQSGENDLDVS